MVLATTIQEVRTAVKAWKKQGLTVGFVPTMGYLHEGHQSLIDAAVAQNDKVVVSIFVNPMQFGPTEDLEQYPRDLERDRNLCKAAGAALIFHPEPEEMYGKNFCSFVNMTGLTEGLCGKSRPVHFRGVCTVVTKLLNIVQPDRAYFGQKDAQQLVVIRRMVEDLNMDVTIVGCPIIREPDGLAKSSRNTYLSPEERQAALVLSRALKAGKEKLEQGVREADLLLDTMREIICQEPMAKIDYVELVDAETLQPINRVDREILVALAVFVGKTRLIDNFIFTI